MWLAEILARHLAHLFQGDLIDFGRTLRVVLGPEPVKLVHCDDMGKSLQ